MQSEKLRIIRKSSFTALPWRNGGGITHEAIRVPAAGEPFCWRVSVAQIEASGPFSDFAAYNRKMVLLRGAGIELRFADGGRQTLREVGDLIEFDGARAAHGELLDGPCVDLNLMVSKSERAATRVERFIDSLEVNTARDETTLIFAVDRALELKVDTLETLTLEPWDLAVMHSSGQLNSLEPAGGRASTSVFLATLKFVGRE